MTRRTKILAVFAVLTCFLAVGATDCNGNSDAGDQKSSNVQERGQALTQQAMKQMEANVPYPAAEMKDPIERHNIAERLLRFNKADKIGYVYLLNNTGSVIAFYPIKGKITSTQSQMTTDNLIIDRYEGDVVVNAPGDDGSYGPNEDGVFFFTTEGVMVQWNGPYIYMDAPLKIASTPVLTYDTNSKPTSTAGQLK